MSRRTAIAIAIAVLAVGAPGGSAAASTSRSAAGACADAGTIATDDATRLAAVESVRCLLNLERANRGLRALRASGLLQRAAEGHSRDMVASKFVGHTSLNGAGVRQRIKRTGYIRRSKMTLVGEVLSWGSGSFASPVQLVAALMESSQHKRTLLDRRFRDVGVGIALGAPMAGMGGSRAATTTVDFGRR
jgi:uncharacterized protein YkwD